MPFSDKQIEDLNAPLSRAHVKARKQGGRPVSYVEGWHVIAEANRIFGFDAWSSETIETKCVVERDRLIGKELLPGWGVTYTARVRIGVYFDDGTNAFRDGYGAGHGIDQDLGQAHESAIKEAETDARKRALMTFGNPFGLALYDKEQTNVIDDPSSRDRFLLELKTKIEGWAADDWYGLVAWLNSPAERKKRDDFGVSGPELMILKEMVNARQPREGS